MRIQNDQNEHTTPSKQIKTILRELPFKQDQNKVEI
jgi:hypothetical protein